MKRPLLAIFALWLTATTLLAQPVQPAAQDAEEAIPPLFRVDFTNKKVIAAGQVTEGMRTETKFQSFQRLDGLLVFQGVELRGWSMVISESSGRITLTASGNEEAFVLFGVCMAQ